MWILSKVPNCNFSNSFIVIPTFIIKTYSMLVLEINLENLHSLRTLGSFKVLWLVQYYIFMLRPRLVLWWTCNFRHQLLFYYELSLGLMTKARACKGAGREGSPKVTFHTIGSVGECEGLNPYTPKWAPTLGVGVPMDSQIFREEFQGSKFIELKSSLYYLITHET